MRTALQWLNNIATDWLIRDAEPPRTPLCDFNRLQFELRPGDIILVEGRSRVAEVIKVITQSPWSHAAIYLGRLYDIQDPDLREVISYHHDGDPNDQLIVEALMGKGTIVSSLQDYQNDHLRICRPEHLAPDDAQRVIAYCAKHLGWDYDIRQILDLARFFFPWSFLPRRWRSSLFEHNAGNATRIVCSTLLAEAFGSVNYPILPFIDRQHDGSLRFFKRNPRLFAPRDFDTSPYFNIIKYPYLGLNDLGLYRKLPWASDSLIYNDDDDAFEETVPAQQEHFPAAAVESMPPSPRDDDAAEVTSGNAASRMERLINFAFLHPSSRKTSGNRS